MVRNKMRKLLVLLLVQVLLTVSDYLIIAPFLPPKPRQLILHFTISENSSSFIQILSVLKCLKDLHHRNPLIQQILKYYHLSVSKEIVFCWLPSHVNIRGNELADLEAKSALSLAITNSKIPHSDFKSNIRLYINNKCQSIWETH